MKSFYIIAIKVRHITTANDYIIVGDKVYLQLEIAEANLQRLIKRWSERSSFKILASGVKKRIVVL